MSNEWKSREYLEAALRDALVALGLVANDIHIRSFGDVDLVDVCICDFKYGQTWMVIYMRQIRLINTIQYDCTCRRNSPGKIESTPEAIALAESVTAKLIEMTDLPWQSFA